MTQHHVPKLRKRSLTLPMHCHNTAMYMCAACQVNGVAALPFAIGWGAAPDKIHALHFTGEPVCI